MRVAALYDVHGNLPALEAVLAEVDRLDVDLIVSGGDLVSGPMPVEVLRKLQLLGDRCRFIRGNADREAVDMLDGVSSGHELSSLAARRLSRADRDFLAALPLTLSLEVDGLGEVLFCHATPRSDTELVVDDTPPETVGPMLDGTSASVIVCGHTHRQFDRQIEGKRLVNAGSVGLPNEEPGAFWALLGPAVDLRRTDYDREAAAEQIRATGWELADELARDNVLNVPSREEVRAYYRSLNQVSGSTS